MFGYCYITFSDFDNRVYIGQKSGQFKKSYLGSGTILKRAINKYGRNRFRVEIIDWAETQDALNDLEISMISIIRSYGGELYNLDGGGKGCPKTDETRRKISAARTGRKMSPEARARLSLVLKGAAQSEARKASIMRAQAARIGLKTPPEVIEKIKKSLALTTKNKGPNCWRFGKKISADEIKKRTETRRINRLKKLAINSWSTTST